VSFDRPYGRQSQFTGIVNDPLSVGSGEYLSFEQPMRFWLEQHGYDVSYCSNSDLLTPERGLKCKCFISIGHDEYWDIRQHDSVAKMRDEGVNLLFLSGNSVCWVTPFRASSSGAPNRIIFRGGPYGGGDWTFTKPEHWIFEGTGVKKGDRIPGLVGWEYHGDPAAIPGLEVVAAGHAWVGGVKKSTW
jgi:hypothetical protein